MIDRSPADPRRPLALRQLPQGSRLSILTRGLLLVAVPLVFQLALIGAYFSLRADTDRAIEWMSESQRATDAAQELYRRLADSLNALRGYRLMPDQYFLDVHERTVQGIADALARLRAAALSADQRERATRIEAQTQALVERLRAERASIDVPGQPTLPLVRMAGLRTEINAFLDQQARDTAVHAVDLERARERQVAVLVVFFIVGLLLTIASAYVFSRSIGQRIARLTENTRRVGAGLAPLYAVEGSDEIAELDHAFRLMANEVQRRTAQLVASNRELESFAAVASHDLQEPLRKIEAFGDRLSTRYSDQIDEQGRDYIARMTSAARRMRQLIDGLLSYSRVSTRQRPPVLVDLARIAREVVGDLETSIERADATVEIGELPSLEADPEQMRQLMQNLLGNALKFRRPDAPLVVRMHGEVLPAGEGVDGSRIQFIVEDNGTGFEQQYAGRMFELFQRLHGRSHSEGVGLGLAICRRIVERHGGTIEALGTPHVGARFVVTLPATPPVEDRPSA